MASVSRTAVALAVAGMFGAIAGPAHAVATYGDISAPGVYLGSGVGNGGWNIETVGNIELALRAKDRGTGVVPDGSSGVYHVSPGMCSGPLCAGIPKADWNYEFSVNVGSGNLLSNYRVEIRVDTDPGDGTSFTSPLDVYINWADNEYFGTLFGERSPTAPGPDTNPTGAPAGDEYVVQQSANPLFGNSGFQPGFNPFTPGLYDIELSIFDIGGTVALASTQIQVAIPVPATALLLGVGLLGAGFFRRKSA